MRLRPRPEQTRPRARSERRPDIEGLRAIAIVAVLLCHAGLPFLAGGYVGVDVFFVISGFLITGLLLRRAATAPGGLAAPLLRPPRQAPAAARGGPARRHGRRLLVVLLRPWSARSKSPGRHRQLRPLRRQLALRRAVGRLLRAEDIEPEPGPAPLVAGGRGAVLRRLAAILVGTVWMARRRSLVAARAVLLASSPSGSCRSSGRWCGPPPTRPSRSSAP